MISLRNILCAIFFLTISNSVSASLTIKSKLVKSGGQHFLEFSVENHSSQRKGLIRPDEPWSGGGALTLKFVTPSKTSGKPIIGYGLVRPLNGDGSCRWIYPGERLQGRLKLEDVYVEAPILKSTKVFWTLRALDCDLKVVEFAGRG